MLQIENQIERKVFPESGIYSAKFDRLNLVGNRARVVYWTTVWRSPTGCSYFKRSGEIQPRRGWRRCVDFRFAKRFKVIVAKTRSSPNISSSNKRIFLPFPSLSLSFFSTLVWPLTWSLSFPLLFSFRPRRSKGSAAVQSEKKAPQVFLARFPVCICIWHGVVCPFTRTTDVKRCLYLAFISV